ncbi:hypothetical protein AB3S75_041496 [Citrus x aurantiifolia]
MTYRSCLFPIRDKPFQFTLSMNDFYSIRRIYFALLSGTQLVLSCSKQLLMLENLSSTAYLSRPIIKCPSSAVHSIYRPQLTVNGSKSTFVIERCNLVKYSMHN